MNETLPIVYLARHGETAWAITGQHTGLTNLPLTERGQRNAWALRERLSGLRFAAVFTSPLQRVSQTCNLAGFGDRAIVDPDLVEWDYGDYEGRRTPDIHKERPAWQLFVDGCPNGESPADVAQRADRIIRRVRDVDDNVLVFSSGHFLRAFAARWLGLEVAVGRCFMLSTASVSAVSYEHKLSQPAIRLWDDTRHLEVDADPHMGAIDCKSHLPRT
jgi:broad specificity phosphatase PhoE